MISRSLDSIARFTRRDAVRLVVAALLLISGLAAILAIDDIPRGLDLAEGDVAGAAVRSPRAIQYVSAVKTAEARQAAQDEVPPQYDYRAETGAAISRRQLDMLAAALVPVDAAFGAGVSPADRVVALGGVLPAISAEARATLLGLDATRWSVIATEATRVLGLVQRSELRDAQVEAERRNLGERFTGQLSDAERLLATEIVGPYLAPNSSYSQSLFDEARAAAAAAVEPQKVSVHQNEIIIEAGRRVTAADVEKLDELGLREATLDVARLAGWALLAALVVVLLLAWIFRYRQELWHRGSALVLLGLMLLVTAFVFKVISGRSILPFFVPAAAPGMLAAILLGSGTGTILTVFLAVIAGTVNGVSLELATYVVVGGLTGILAIRRADRVGVFVQAGFAILAANVVVVSIFSLLGTRDVTGILQLWGASAAAAAGSAVAAVGTFQAIGNIFGILTVFQLLELANPSQPLLRRLLLETPGTYHHSLMVGNLAERAASAIGADSLLARVAAYYHDVGKLANPAAFIENQAGTQNVHDELDPEMSAAILRAHVADGIDLAYRSRLPKPLIAFIPQHHGTARLSYFWAKAREAAAAPLGGLGTAAGLAAADGLDDRKFRHAGPKPQSREAAILMLADGVEASVRSLANHDEPTIRVMVGRIIDERLDDGQFDECDLTLRDIEGIREAFVAQLLGMYHQRIAYPQNKIVELEARRGAGGGTGA